MAEACIGPFLGDPIDIHVRDVRSCVCHLGGRYNEHSVRNLNHPRMMPELTGIFMDDSLIIQVMVVSLACVVLNTTEIVRFVRSSLRPKFYLVFQVAKTALWTSIVLVLIINAPTSELGAVAFATSGQGALLLAVIV